MRLPKEFWKKTKAEFLDKLKHFYVNRKKHFIWQLLPEKAANGAISLLAIMRHPFSSKDRKSFRAKLHLEKAVNAAINLLAIMRHPFSSKDRKSFRAILHLYVEGHKRSLSNEIKEEIAKATKYEPRLGDPFNISHSYVAPYRDSMNEAQRRMRDRITAASYETVVCVPWIRQGGADLVAGLFSASLQRLCPNGSLLLIRTDSPLFERPDWIPNGVDIVDLSDIFSSMKGEDAERLLCSLLVGLAPKRVVNINSRLCWMVFARFGQRLANVMSLYSYLFCWDLDKQGHKLGYPVEFYPNTAPAVSAFFTDTEFMKNELVQMFALPASMRNRIVTLHTPAQSQVESPSATERAIKRARHLGRPLVLWAGRLDRQKRFDLVQKIASRMPQVDFACWGEPLLDEPPDLSALPPNISMRGTFKVLDELPLSQCDAWLFTSEWEGLPTLLIELGAKGVPIVASAVGGVPELIDDKTGWPVKDIENVTEYIVALEQVIDHEEARLERVRKLQNVVRIKHSIAAYDSQLRSVLDNEPRPISQALARCSKTS